MIETESEVAGYSGARSILDVHLAAGNNLREKICGRQRNHKEIAVR